MTNVRRNLAVQLIPVGGANPLKMRLVATGFVVGTAGTTGALIGQGGIPAYAYSIVSGSLPTGLSLNSSTGVISGTPSVAGTFTFTAQIQDSALTAFIATFSINVAHIVQPVQFTPPTYDAGTGNQIYQFTVSGSTGTVTWSATSLPAWATMSSGGLLTVATSSVFPAASATISVTASDAGTGDSYTASVRLVVVQALQVILTTAGPTNITIGTTVTFDAKAQIVPFGGQTPYLYQLVASVNPAAPSWVSINPTTGVLTLSPPPTYSPQTIAFDYVISDIAGGSRVVTIRAPFVNPNNVIQAQQSGSNVGSAGFSTKNYTGGAWNISNSAGVLTISLPAATNSVPGYLTAADHATLSSSASSLSSFGAVPNSAGCSLTGGVFTMQPANASFPGGLLSADWVSFNRKTSLVSANTTVPAGNTVANTTTATAFTSTTTFPAALAAGSIVKIRAAGTYGTAAAGTNNLTMVLLIAGVVGILNTGAVTLTNSISGKSWVLEGYFTVTTAGSSGQIECRGESRFYSTAASVLDVFADLGSLGPVGINVGQTISLQVAWSVASASNTITLRQFHAEAWPA